MDSGTGKDLKAQVSLTGQSIIQQLRKIVQPPGKKGTWLGQVSDKRLAEVYHRLKKGQAAYHIAKIAQIDWGMMRGSETRSLARAILKIKEKMIGELVDNSPQKSEAGTDLTDRLRKRGKRILKNLDGLGRLRWLIEEQTDRVVMMRDKEKTMNLPLKDTNAAIHELGDLITQYLTVQMKLGLLDAQPSEHVLTIKTIFDRMISGVSDDGKALSSAVHKFIEQVDRDVVNLEVSADGSYKLLEEKNDNTDDSD